MQILESIPPFLGRAVLIYISIVWLCSILLTISDKRRARRRRRRVPERTLMLFGFFGGALPMYLCMKAIRHKTLHKKFMIGLPLIMLLHIFLLIFAAVVLTKWA